MAYGKNKKLAVEVNEKEFTRLLQVTESMHHKIAFMLAWGSGLRVSEVAKLQKRDIDTEKRTIRINEGKGMKDRIVRLPADWQEHHINHIPMKCGIRAIQKAFEIYSEKAGIRKDKPTVHFHSLRHGFCTHMIRGNMKISNVQMLLGHDNVATTQAYIRLAPEEAFEEFDRITGAS